MMKKIIFITVLLISLFVLSPSQASAQLQCDECGYCIGQVKPGNWDACKACLYPNTANTLSTTTTEPGNFYTQLGCIKTGIANTATQTGTGLHAGVTGAIANFLLNKFLFPLAGILSFLYIIYGAYLLMTSQDNPERKLQGRGTVTGAIVGVIFTILSVFLVNFIAADVLRIPGFAKGPPVQFAMSGSSSKDINGNETFPSANVIFKNQTTGDEVIIRNYKSIQANADFNIKTTYGQILFNPTEHDAIIRNLTDLCPKCKCTPNCNIASDGCCDWKNNPGLACAPLCASDPGDRNLFVKRLIISGQTCQKFKYQGLSGNYIGTYTLRPDGRYDSTRAVGIEPSVGMFWTGDLICEEWN